MEKKQIDVRVLQHPLLALGREIHCLRGIGHLLGWDQEIYMPEAAIESRADMRALIAKLGHEKMTSPAFEEALRQAEIKNDSDPILKDICRLFRRDLEKAKKLPTAFVEEFSKVTSEAQVIWEKAKEENSWSMFYPTFRKIVELVQQKAEYLGYDDHPYDALIDEYEPDTTSRDIQRLFDGVKQNLVPILNKLAPLDPADTKTHHVAEDLRSRPEILTTVTEQLQISRELISLIGYDWKKSRLDLSAHPFSTAFHPTDSRITIRKSSSGLLDQLMSALHEAGHSLYEMGLPQEHFGTPLGEAASLGVHESQSRLWEVMIGRSQIFSKTIETLLTKNNLKGHIAKIGSVYTALNTVKRSFIRTEADEVTYPLHVILRFEIEKELIEGTTKPQDLPERWNAGMKSLLGISPTTDKEGCLQDIHWSMGAFGYFPTYLLGTMYAVELFDAIKRANPQWQESISLNNFQFVHTWLQNNIWCHGRRFGSIGLIEKAIGRKLDPETFTNYLKEKYAP